LITRVALHGRLYVVKQNGIALALLARRWTESYLIDACRQRRQRRYKRLPITVTGPRMLARRRLCERIVTNWEDGRVYTGDTSRWLVMGLIRLECPQVGNESSRKSDA